LNPSATNFLVPDEYRSKILAALKAATGRDCVT
jgi:hypothetical protein